jgi:hypothetical protein
MRKLCSAAIVAAALALLIAQPFSGTAATLPSVHVPTVTTPAVTVPAATVPSATVPSVTTPVGSTPTVSAPSATTPSATTPSATTPSVTTTPSRAPAVTAPSAPSVTVPSLKAPSLPVAAPSSGSSSSAPSPASAASPGAQRTARADAAAAGHRAGARGSTGGERSRQAQARAENRRLRAIVARYAGCLSSLDQRSQRLLSLRAGVSGSPRSAGAVARILDISLGREQLLERLSLLALQTAGAGGCGGSTPVAAVLMSGASRLTSAAPWVTSATGGAGSARALSSGPTARARVRAAGGRTVTPTVITPNATRTVERASTSQDTASSAEIVVFAMLLLAISVVLLPRVRRRLVGVLAGFTATDGATEVAPGAVFAASTVRRSETPPPPAPAEVSESPAPAELAAEPMAPAPAPAQPAAERSQPSWVREHAAQGALVATVIAGAVMRALRRGRGR